MLRRRTYEPGKAVGTYESKKVKRYRSAFTTGQVNYLEKQFEKCPYIGSATRKEVANLLSIPERAVKIWFQNRRMKEKKEISNKDYNLQCQINLTNNLESAKDSLINVHSLQSVNDIQCSLQSNVAKHVDKTNCTNYYDDAVFSNHYQMNNIKKEKVDESKPSKSKDADIANNIKKNVYRNTLSKPANYNFNKVYNNNNFVNHLESKKGLTKGKVLPKTAFKDRISTIKGSIPNATVTLPQYQDLPEDLSATRKFSNVMIPQNYQANIHLNSAYIPFCNQQNVHLTAGNVVWKPINVMPAVPNTVPVAIPERQSNVNQNNHQKCKCNCDCHSKNIFNYDQMNLEAQPQYVIAIPYNNNLNIL